MQPLTLIGRTAFTSYLGQTVIGVGVFYGVGLIATLGLALPYTQKTAVQPTQGRRLAKQYSVRYCQVTDVAKIGE
jgi:hypothetical protein